MARLIGRLSARKVKNAKPPKGRDSYDFPDGGNLYLQVSNSTPDKKIASTSTPAGHSNTNYAVAAAKWG